MRVWRSAWLPRGLGATLWLCLVCLLSAPVAADDSDRLQLLKRKIGQLEQQLVATRRQQGKTEKELAKLEPAMGRLHQKIAALTKKLRQGRAKLAELNRREQQLNRQRLSQQEQLAQLVRNSYLNGQESGLKLLLNQQDPALLSRNLVYYDYLAKARSQQIQQFNQTLKDLGQVGQALRATQLELTQQKKQLEKEKQQLAEGQAQRRHLLKQLAARLKTQGKSLSSMRTQRQELEKVFEAVANIDLGINGVPFAKSRGRLPWPVQGKLLGGYGQERSGFPLKGLLVGASAGSSVRAVHHGQVVFANWLRGYGLVLIVDHGNQYLSLYAHSESLSKNVGDWVQPGDVLGQVGDTGGAGQTALYFEMRRRGKAFNPKPWLKKR